MIQGSPTSPPHRGRARHHPLPAPSPIQALPWTQTHGVTPTPLLSCLIAPLVKWEERVRPLFFLSFLKQQESLLVGRLPQALPAQLHHKHRAVCPYLQNEGPDSFHSWGRGRKGIWGSASHWPPDTPGLPSPYLCQAQRSYWRLRTLGRSEVGDTSGLHPCPRQPHPAQPSHTLPACLPLIGRPGRGHLAGEPA